MGVLAAGRATPAGLFEATLSGRSPAQWVTLPGLATPLAASVAPEPELTGSEFRHSRRLDRCARLGLAAARQAIAQAGVLANVDLRNVGVMLGTSRGTLGRTLAAASDGDQGAVSPTAAADSTPSSVSGIVSQVFGFGGPNATVSATCASAAVAIGLGASTLLSGEADVMVVGGAEASLVPLLAGQLQAAGVLGWHEEQALTCRPFDVERNGLMVGEGAACVVLERRSSAERRGAPLLARLSGWASGIDAGGRTGVTNNGEGLVRVIGRALKVARLEPDEIGYVNAHGTGTRLNDAVEARALNRVFGGTNNPPVSSTKPITGHCLGATAAIEAVITIEALRNRCVPPTANLTQLDSECDLDVIVGQPRTLTAGAALSNSLGFWGWQAALVFETV